MIRHAVATRGPLVLWTGTVASVYRSVPSGAVYFSILRSMQALCEKGGLPVASANLVSGFFSRAFVSTLLNPLSVIKARFEVRSIHCFFQCYCFMRHSVSFAFTSCLLTAMYARAVCTLTNLQFTLSYQLPAPRGFVASAQASSRPYGATRRTPVFTWRLASNLKHGLAVRFTLSVFLVLTSCTGRDPVREPDSGLAIVRPRRRCLCIGGDAAF